MTCTIDCASKHCRRVSWCVRSCQSCELVWELLAGCLRGLARHLPPFSECVVRASLLHTPSWWWALLLCVQVHALVRNCGYPRPQAITVMITPQLTRNSHTHGTPHHNPPGGYNYHLVWLQVQYHLLACQAVLQHAHGTSWQQQSVRLWLALLVVVAGLHYEEEQEVSSPAFAAARCH